MDADAQEKQKLILEKLEEWNRAKLQLANVAPIVAKEMELRKEIFALMFPQPKEGTNTYSLPNDWKVKGTYKLDRKLDNDALPAVMAELRKDNVIADALVRYVPELNTKDYKALSEQHRLIFEQAMTIKPASPTLELIPPKGSTA